MLVNLAFMGFSYRPLSSVIDTEILVSKTIFKMRWRLLSKYLAIENTVKGVAEGLRLKVKLKVEGLWAEGLSSLLISLSIK